MSRTSPPKVCSILPGGTTLTTAQIQAAIDAATAVMDDVAAGCGQYLSDASLLQCETYLAAHFAAVMENSLSISSEKDPACGSSITYGFKFGEGVMGTPFGQMANTLSGGCLKEQDKVFAGLIAIGEANGSAEDYFR